MEWLERRREKKAAKEALSGVRQALRMRGDVAGAESVRKGEEAARALRDALMNGERERWKELSEAAWEAAGEVMPVPKFAKWKENVEVLVVALGLAMACRTYFIQPFKIPTGSMQPTLNGVTARPQTGGGWSDKVPVSWVKWLATGESYKEVRAKAAGRVGWGAGPDGKEGYVVGGIFHPVTVTRNPDAVMPRSLEEAFVGEQGMQLHAKLGDWAQKGDLLASGVVRAGDHVFVNRMAYRFGNPERGDIVVFDTNFIPTNQAQQVARDTYYIKRLVGLPGERIGIREGRLTVDGETVREPKAFERQATAEGYRGYVTRPDSRLRKEGDEIALGEDEFLPFGDNTMSSLDGRYFGGVSEKALMGPAFCVYWPFGEHWGKCW